MNTLLICPQFFGYEKDIFQAILKQKHDVIYCDEKPYNNNLFKILLRLFGKSKIIRLLIKKHLHRSLEGIKNKVDNVIIVKGESFTIENISYLKERFPEAKFIFYAWDSIKNYPHIIEYLPLFDRCFTFDDNDVNEYSFLIHLPLFYAKDYEVSSGARLPPKKPKIVFAGTVHSDRYQLLGKIYEKYKNQYDFDFFLYFPSKILLLNFIKSNYRQIFRYKIKSFSLKSKSKAEIAEYFLEATAVIDIQHPKQHGLTMRTIELLPLHRKLITTNVKIKDYDFYSADNIMIIDRDDPCIDEGIMSQPYSNINEDVIHKYSVDGWIKSLLADK